MAMGLAEGLTTLVSGCASLPLLEGRSATPVVADTADTRLGRALAPQLAAHLGRSGIHALSTGMAAFAARVASILAMRVRAGGWGGRNVRSPLPSINPQRS